MERWKENIEGITHKKEGEILCFDTICGKVCHFFLAFLKNKNNNSEIFLCELSKYYSSNRA